MLLVLGSIRHVQGFNHVFKILAIGVHVLQGMWADEFLIVELGDLVLFVVKNSFEVVPCFAGKSLEKIPFFLASFGLWFFRPLIQEKWKGEHLLSV